MEPTNLRCYMYVKLEGDTQFKAWNYDAGKYASKLIYCTLVDDTPLNRKRLQDLANLNKSLHMQIQLRKSENQQIIFQTK